MAFVCDCQQKKQVLNFLTTNLQAANNMSDEEMEDVISELTKTAVAMNCQQRLVWFDYDRNVNLKKEQLDSCQSIFSVKYEKLDLN